MVDVEAVVDVETAADVVADQFGVATEITAASGL